MKMRGSLSLLYGAATYAALSCALLANGSVQAREARSDAIAFNIPGGSLQAALTAFAGQSGLQLIYAPENVAGRAASAVREKLPAHVALDRLIKGTGLHIRQVNERVIVLERYGTRPGTGALTVSGEADAASQTAAPIPDSIAASGVGSERSAPDPMTARDKEIVVTGTRIRGAASPSPRTTATRQALEDAGITDMAGFSRILLQNFTGGQNPGVAGGGDQGGQNNINNSATLNLRGLGADATLTLINGHRLAYDALNQGIDISTIPLAAIERVEVVADGASALYGSDAVGGVANIVLRRDYSGAQVNARYGASTDGGNSQQQYTGVTGARWNSGGVMVAADYTHSVPITAADRSYTRHLDESQMLLLHNSQFSAVVTGHQRLAEGVTFEIDAQFANRRSRKATAFFVTRDAYTDGLVNRPRVRTWALTPVVRIELPSQWTASLEFTRSVSKTDVLSHRFTAGVDSPGRLIYENHLTNIEGSAEGPLVRLPGGDARLAIGAGYRKFGLDIDVSQIVGGASVTTSDAREKRNSFFAYGELAVPVVGPANRSSGFYDLHLSAAVRYERYEGIDEVATPKFGIVYAPHRDVTFKASWGRSFKIPTLNQINQVQAGSLLPAGMFAPQPSPGLPAGATVLLLGGGNPDLHAERATTWTATMELRPRFIPDLEITATYFDVDYRQRIASPVTSVLSSLGNPAFADFITFNPSAQQIEAIIAGLPEGLSNQSGGPFDPAGVGAIIDTSLRNTARERARGLDISALYRAALGEEDTLTLTAAASYLDADRKLSAGQAPLERSGVIFTPPHWRVRGGLNWERANTQVAASLNYAGGVVDNRFVVPTAIGTFTTLDLSAGFRSTAQAGLLRNVDLRVSALNILNEKPDVIRTTDPAAIPFDSTNQSSIGRFVSLAVTKSW